MKPFNLEKALAGERVITNDGREVLDMAYLQKRKWYPVLVLFADANIIQAYTIDGLCCLGNENDNLFMYSQKMTYYLNIYRNKKSKEVWTAKWTYLTEEESRRNISDLDFYVKTIAFEIEDD
jgi:hypothetical protein